MSIRPVSARLRSFLPKCHLSSFKLHVLTPRHVFTPPPMNRQGTLARRSIATPPLPRLTSRGTHIDLACPTRCPLHLTLNLNERLSYMTTLLPSSTHVAILSVARISVVHQSPKPKQHIPGATHARFD